MKPHFRELAWFFLTIITFLILTVWVEGPGIGRGYDFESCLTLTRYLKGDPWSLIVKNLSPVVQYSIPYGGWPPLFILLESFWLIFNIPISHCNLLSGMFSILLFGIATVYLVKRLNPDADMVLVLMISILSPIALNHVDFGGSFILIPFAAVFSLILVPLGNNISKKQYIHAFIAGFIIGLSDWHVYFIIPALVYFIIFPSKSKPSINYNNVKFIKWVAALAAGFLLAFILYKLVVMIDYYNNINTILYVNEGITFDKFVNRIYRSPSGILIAIYLSVARAFFASLPIIVLTLIMKASKTGFFDKFNSNLRFIFCLSVLSPILFIMLFNVQVSASNHSFEAIVFLAPVSIFTSKIVIKDSYKNLIYSIFILVLFLMSLFAFKGNALFPDKYLLFSGHKGFESPMDPGEYDLSLNPTEYSLFAMIKSLKNQITLLPACHPRLVKVNAFNRTINNFRMYGDYIRKETAEDEIIIMFGETSEAVSYYCQRPVLGVESIDTLLEKYNKFHQKKWKVALLLPKDSSIKIMDNLNLYEDYFTKVNQIEHTPYKIIHLWPKKNH
jgi:hypothetical protein